MSRHTGPPSGADMGRTGAWLCRNVCDGACPGLAVKPAGGSLVGGMVSACCDTTDSSVPGKLATSGPAEGPSARVGSGPGTTASGVSAKVASAVACGGKPQTGQTCNVSWADGWTSSPDQRWPCGQTWGSDMMAS